jgi:hypothetical protein
MMYGKDLQAFIYDGCGVLIAQSRHEQYQVRRQLNRSLIHARAKPLADFLTERHAMDAAERSVTLVRRISHEDIRLSVDAASGELAAGGHKVRASRIFAPWSREATILSC